MNCQSGINPLKFGRSQLKGSSYIAFPDLTPGRLRWVGGWLNKNYSRFFVHRFRKPGLRVFKISRDTECLRKQRSKVIPCITKT